MKHFLMGILVLCQISLLAQEKLIVGRITDTIGEPLCGVIISQKKPANAAISDSNGFFHLLIDEINSAQISFGYIGYKTVTFSNLDTISGLLEVKMTTDTVFEDIKHTTPPKQESKFSVFTFFQIDALFNDFAGFRPLLKDYNVDNMNKWSIIFTLELAMTYKRFYTGLSFGHQTSYNDYDSLDIELKKTQWGLHFGYNILNTKRILFAPKVAIKWNRYRLLNYDKEKSISIEQYVSERDLDIRFNQITGFVGFNLTYKIYNLTLFGFDYSTCGIYGGYIFQFNEKPWIYSGSNRLISNEIIKVKNYSIGFVFSHHFN